MALETEGLAVNARRKERIGGVPWGRERGRQGEAKLVTSEEDQHIDILLVCNAALSSFLPLQRPKIHDRESRIAYRQTVNAEASEACCHYISITPCPAGPGAWVPLARPNGPDGPITALGFNLEGRAAVCNCSGSYLVALTGSCCQ